MDANKRKRIIEKLRKLADPQRNPNKEEVAAANAKLEELLLEEQRETEGALRKRMNSEPFELRELFDWGRKPKLWERSLFGFMCRINQVKGIYTVRDNRLHLFRAAGRPAHIRKAELQFLWAHSRIKDVSKRLPSNTAPAYRESYEFGAARELVEVMKSVTDMRDYKEASAWIENQLRLLDEPEPATAIDPYWSEGRKSLKRSFYPEE